MNYIASPYSHPSAEMRQWRYEAVNAYTVARIKQGACCISPIKYLHNDAVEHQMPLDALFWHSFNMQLLRRADAIEVLCIPGWEESKGVQSEMQIAEHLGIPIIFART